MFWGLIRTPPEKRDHAAIEAGKKNTTTAMVMVDEQLGKTAYLAGDAFSYGDIPVGIMAYRYRQLVPERPPLKNFERWYAAISARQAFKDQVALGAADVDSVVIREARDERSKHRNRLLDARRSLSSGWPLRAGPVGRA